MTIESPRRSTEVNDANGSADPSKPKKNNKVVDFVSEHRGTLFPAAIFMGLGYLSIRYGQWDKGAVGKACTELVLLGAAVLILSRIKIGIDVKTELDKKLKIDDFTLFLVDTVRKKTTNQKGRILGQDKLISDIRDVLSKDEKNNVVLLGPPGCGKTAAVLNLAQEIAKGKIPALKDYEIISLDITAMIRGASIVGQFEERVALLVKYLEENKKSILFIDELHRIRESYGGHSNTTPKTLADMLKPVLAKGIRCIGATTEYEYNDHIAQDGALNRRFEKLYISPMTKEITLDLLVKSKKERFEDVYQVEIEENVLKFIVELTDKEKDLFFPDKAITLLNTICSSARNNKKSKVTEESIKDFFENRIVENFVTNESRD